MRNRTPYNFCGLETQYSAYNTSHVVLLPVPFDRTSTWMKGSRHGPQAVINASRNLELYDIETETEVYRQGLHTARPVKAKKPEQMVSKVKDRVYRYLTDGKFSVVLGGEHSVSIGSIKAHVEHFKSLSILHLDAHSDRRKIYNGSRYNHACVMARVNEIVETVVSVGIRSIDSSEMSSLRRGHIFLARDCVSSNEYIKQIPSLLIDPVYITIDLDVFDPGIMPSTGTPEPGGLGWYDVIALLKKVIKNRQVVGFDVVELCPTHIKASDFLAAKLVYKTLSFIFQGD